ncbi:MAG: type II toxin-antitoxin system HicA family toxin [Chloroflexi bacterium]|nr:type II toxin-antitoxin system HicA family toxin [Chloroflexota bacterium]
MKYRELTQRLRAQGCEFVRNGSGSHRIWWNPVNNRYTSIPDWGNKDLKTGMLRAILSDLGLTPREIQKR